MLHGGECIYHIVNEYLVYMYVYAYRAISRGRKVANRQYVVIPLAETIRQWWANPRIAKLLRYGFEYQRRDLEYDVQDGKLWLEFLQKGNIILHAKAIAILVRVTHICNIHTGATLHDLAWTFVCDGMEINGRYSPNYSLIPCKILSSYNMSCDDMYI